MKRKVALLFTAISLFSSSFVFANENSINNEISTDFNTDEGSDDTEIIKSTENLQESFEETKEVSEVFIDENEEFISYLDENFDDFMQIGQKYLVNIDTDANILKENSLLIEKTESSTYILTLIINDASAQNISFSGDDGESLTKNYSNYDIISVNLEIKSLDGVKTLEVDGNFYDFTINLDSLTEFYNEQNIENGYYNVKNFAIVKDDNGYEYDKSTSSYIKSIDLATLNGENFVVITFDEENSVFKNFTMTMDLWYKSENDYTYATVTDVSEKNCNMQFKFPLSSLESLVEFKYSYTVAEIPTIKGTYERIIYIDLSSIIKVRDVTSDEFVFDEEDTPSDDSGDTSNTGNSGSSSSGSSSSSVSSSKLDKDNLEDGTYTVEIDLWNASSNEASMGNDAIYRKAILDVKNGVYTMSISTKPMSLGIYNAVLQGLLVLNESGEYEEAKVLSRGFSLGDETDLPTAFSFDLPEKGEEYVQVRILTKFYPEFPGHDDLKARVKIDWDTLKEDSDATLTEYTGSTSTTTEISISDENTGIKITPNTENTFEDVTLDVHISYDDENIYEIFYNMEQEIEKFIKYDLIFTKNDENFIPSDVFTVYIPFPNDFDVTKTEVYRLNDDNTLTLINFEIENDEIVFKTSTLTTFIIVENVEAVLEPVLLSAEIKNDDYIIQMSNDFENHYAKESIEFVKEAGILVGTDENTFAPNETITLAMLVTAISRLENVDQSYSVWENEKYYYPAMKWAIDNRIISTFYDEEYVTKNLSREEAIVIISNYINFKNIHLKELYSLNFTDEEQISIWAKNSVDSLAKAGIIFGREGFLLAPKDFATRAEVAIILEKIMKSYL